MANTLVENNTFAGDTGAGVIIPHSNTSNITLGLDQTGGPDDYTSVVVSKGFMKDLGSVGGSLRCCTDHLACLSGGNIWFQAEDDGVTGKDTDDVTILMMEPGNRVVLSSATSSTFQNIRALRGHLTIATSMLWHASGRLDVGFVGNRQSDMTVIIPATGATVPLINMSGGIVNCDSVITAAIVAGGVLRVDSAIPVLVNVFAGGVFKLNHTAATTIIVHPGGVLDTTEVQDFKTITTLVLHPGSTFIKAPDTDAVTVTNLTDLRDLANAA